jgi:FMN phosphatase YigB (HAD superfamily)
MRTERLALFDLDGTIIDTDAANIAAYLLSLQKSGIVKEPRGRGRITAGTIRALAGAFASVDDIVRMKDEMYCHQLWRTKLGPAAGAFRHVLLNRNRFRKVVLLTNSKERRAKETLRHYGWEHLFDEIYCNGGRGNKYANYFMAFDSDPAMSVVWENEERQVMSAIAAGVRVENIRKVG